MEVLTGNKNLRKALASNRDAVRLFGKEMALILSRRVATLDSIQNLGDLWPPNSGPERCHELIGDRAGTFSMNLRQPYRLLFKPIATKKVDYKDDKAWWASIESVELLAVEDTHD